MKTYVIRFRPRGAQETTQLEIEGDFTLWREDAGFYNENMMDVALEKLEAGRQTVYADTEGVTSLVCVETE